MNGEAIAVSLADGGVVRGFVAGAGEPVVLLHGWPQTSQCWRSVAEILASEYRVIALDLPGLGDSSPPVDYRKSTIARLVWSAVQQLVSSGEEVRIVGHDWGAIVGYLCAKGAPAEVSQLAVVDVVTPLEFDGLPLLMPSGNPAWHFLFHGIPELPEMLIDGKEERYLRWWFTHLAHSAHSVSESAIASYVSAYRRPGAVGSSLEYYRCVFDDIEDFRRAATVKLEASVLAIGGEYGVSAEVFRSFTAVADRVDSVIIPDSGHWIPDERPAQLADVLQKFFVGGFS